MGNRTIYTATNDITIVTTYTYNASNQLTTAKADNSPDTWYYEYDGNGNQVRQIPNGLTPTAGEIRYTFNQRNQLTLVEKHNGSSYQAEAAANYDGDGNRLQTTVYIAGNPVVINYTVDVQLHGEPIVIHNPVEADIYVIHGLGEYQDSWNYYLMDVQMSVRQLVDENGNVLVSRTYDPSGSILKSSGVEDSVFGFAGAQNGALGLLYFNGRYYDPTTGRYLSPDYSHFNPLHPSQDNNGYLVANLLANPSGLLFGPLLIFSWRKRKKNGKYPDVWLLVAGISLGIWMVGCQAVPGTPTPNGPPPTQAMNPTAILNPTLPPSQPPPATAIGEPPTVTPILTSSPAPTPTPSTAGVIPGSDYNNVHQYLNGIPEMKTGENILLGPNACGLVAAAHGVGGDDNWQYYMQRILENTTGYGTNSGIQPSNYLASLKASLMPEFNIIERNDWSISGMLTALQQEHVVIVDIHVDRDTYQPAAPPVKKQDETWSHYTFAHFAQVLAIDPANIYLDNSIWRNESQKTWTVPHPLFMQAWDHPETSSNLPENRTYTPEYVTNWGVEIIKVN